MNDTRCSTAWNWATQASVWMTFRMTYVICQWNLTRNLTLVSSTGHLHVIRRSSAHCPQVVHMRIQSPKYFQLNTRATALLKTKGWLIWNVHAGGGCCNQWINNLQITILQKKVVALYSLLSLTRNSPNLSVMLYMLFTWQQIVVNVQKFSTVRKMFSLLVFVVIWRL